MPFATRGTKSMSSGDVTVSGNGGYPESRDVVYCGQEIRVQVPQYYYSVNDEDFRVVLQRCAQRSSVVDGSTLDRIRTGNGKDVGVASPSGSPDHVFGRESELETRSCSHPDLQLTASDTDYWSDDRTPSGHIGRYEFDDIRKNFVCSIRPRTVVLRKTGGTFGFVLCGAKSKSPETDVGHFHSTAQSPALQYLESVEPDSVAGKAGLRAGDYVLEINGINVVSESHTHTVRLIRQAGDAICLKVVTPSPSGRSQRQSTTPSTTCRSTPSTTPSPWSPRRPASRSAEPTSAVSTPKRSRRLGEADIVESGCCGRHVLSAASSTSSRRNPVQLSRLPSNWARSMPDLTAVICGSFKKDVVCGQTDGGKSTGSSKRLDSSQQRVEVESGTSCRPMSIRDRVMYQLTSQLRPATTKSKATTSSGTDGTTAVPGKNGKERWKKAPPPPPRDVSLQKDNGIPVTGSRTTPDTRNGCNNFTTSGSETGRQQLSTIQKDHPENGKDSGIVRKSGERMAFESDNQGTQSLVKTDAKLSGASNCSDTPDQTANEQNPSAHPKEKNTAVHKDVDTCVANANRLDGITSEGVHRDFSSNSSNFDNLSDTGQPSKVQQQKRRAPPPPPTPAQGLPSTPGTVPAPLPPIPPSPSPLPPTLQQLPRAFPSTSSTSICCQTSVRPPSKNLRQSFDLSSCGNTAVEVDDGTDDNREVLPKSPHPIRSRRINVNVRPKGPTTRRPAPEVPKMPPTTTTTTPRTPACINSTDTCDGNASVESAGKRSPPGQHHVHQTSSSGSSFPNGSNGSGADTVVNFLVLAEKARQDYLRIKSRLAHDLQQSDSIHADGSRSMDRSRNRKDGKAAAVMRGGICCSEDNIASVERHIALEKSASKTSGKKLHGAEKFDQKGREIKTGCQSDTFPTANLNADCFTHQNSVTRSDINGTTSETFVPTIHCASTVGNKIAARQPEIVEIHEPSEETPETALHKKNNVKIVRSKNVQVRKRAPAVVNGTEDGTRHGSRPNDQRPGTGCERHPSVVTSSKHADYGVTSLPLLLSPPPGFDD